MQINLFEELYQTFKFDPGYKVKLFEAFAGVGMQRMAMNRLNANYESIGISEIDKHAINSYMAVHGETKNYGSICDIVGGQLPSIDVFTYSFPCTDLSKAGKQKGLNQDTRSGLVYEVLRILHELNELNNLPKVLIMENVVDLVQVKFIKQFNEIQFELEQLGYKNYTDVLNAKDYGVAQNRERVFMVSMLGDYNYNFPKKIKLEKKLKDYLEDEVDEKYYLSDEKINQISKWNAQQDPLENAKTNEDDIIQCITAKSNTSLNASMILIKEATTKGYDIAYEGDSVTLDQPNSKTRRGRVGEKIANTLTTSCNLGVVTENLRIRKLTDLESWRLMGIDDEDFYKAQKVCSKSQLYKQAGNGIVVDVFAAILKELF